MLTALAEHPASAGPGPTLDGPTTVTRSRLFEENPDGRFWWHKLRTSRFVPPVYGQLEDREWKLLEEWFEETSELGAIGEINVPAMSVVQGLVMGNGLSRIVQLGHFYGYSALAARLHAAGDGSATRVSSPSTCRRRRPPSHNVGSTARG